MSQPGGPSIATADGMPKHKVRPHIARPLLVAAAGLGLLTAQGCIFQGNACYCGCGSEPSCFTDAGAADAGNDKDSPGDQKRDGQD